MRHGGKECPDVEEGGLPELIAALQKYRPERLIIVCHFYLGEHGKGRASLYSPSSGFMSQVDEDDLVGAIVEFGINLKVVIFDTCYSETAAALLHKQWRARVCHIQAWSTKTHDGGAAILLAKQMFYVGRNYSAAESLRMAKLELNSSGIEVRITSDGGKSEYPKFVVGVDPMDRDLVYQDDEDVTTCPHSVYRGRVRQGEYKNRIAVGIMVVYFQQPEVCDLEQSRDRDFVGREDELRDLARCFLSRDSVVESVGGCQEEGGSPRRSKSDEYGKYKVGGNAADASGGGGSMSRTPTQSWLAASFRGRAAVLWGGELVGKSSIAYEYAWRAVYNAGEYPGGVITLQANGAGDSALRESIRVTLLYRLTKSEEQRDKWRKEISHSYEITCEAWNIMHGILKDTKHKMLVILDNATNDPLEAKVWNDLLKLTHVDTLKTCQRRCDNESHIIESIEVPALDNMSAKQLLVRHAMPQIEFVDSFLDELPEQEMQALVKLVKARDYYPLLLVMAAGELLLSAISSRQADAHAPCTNTKCDVCVVFARFMDRDKNAANAPTMKKTSSRINDLRPPSIETMVQPDKLEKMMDELDIKFPGSMQLEIKYIRDVVAARLRASNRSEADASPRRFFMEDSIDALSEGARHILCVMAFMQSWGVPSVVLIGDRSAPGCIGELRDLSLVEKQEYHNYGGGGIKLKSETIARSVRKLIERGLGDQSGVRKLRKVFFTACNMLISHMQKWEHLSGCGSSDDTDKRLVLRLRAHAEHVLGHAERIFAHLSAQDRSGAESKDGDAKSEFDGEILSRASFGCCEETEHESLLLCEVLALLHYWSGRVSVDFDPERALQYYADCSQLCIKHGGPLIAGHNAGDFVLLARCLHAQSVALQRLGRLDEAMTKCKDSYRVHEHDHDGKGGKGGKGGEGGIDHRDIAESCHRESEIEYRMTTRTVPRLTQAEDCCTKALEMRQRIAKEDTGRQLQLTLLQIAQTQNLYALILNAQSEVQTAKSNATKADAIKAEELAEKALGMCKLALGTRKQVHTDFGNVNHLDIASSLRLKGLILLTQSQRCVLDVTRSKLATEAHAEIDAAMIMFEKNGDSMGMSLCLEAMGKLEQVRGNAQEALDCAKRALGIKTSYDGHHTEELREEILRGYRTLAERTLATGNEDEADALIEESLSHSSIGGDSFRTDHMAWWKRKKRELQQANKDNVGMWTMAAERFAAPPFSNGSDKRYEVVKAEIRTKYGASAVNENNKARLKNLAISKGEVRDEEGDEDDDESVVSAEDPPLQTRGNGMEFEDDGETKDPGTPQVTTSIEHQGASVTDIAAMRSEPTLFWGCREDVPNSLSPSPYIPSRDRNPYRNPLNDQDRAWRPDNAAVQCKCNRSFGIFQRRHHCRQCGEVSAFA